MSNFAPDTTYRGLRINQDGNRNWQVCYDYPGGRFRILAANLASVEAAKTLIEALRPGHAELLAEVERLQDALELAQLDATGDCRNPVHLTAVKRAE